MAGKEAYSEKKGFLPVEQIWWMEQWGNAGPKREQTVDWHWSWAGGSCQGGVAVFGWALQWSPLHVNQSLLCIFVINIAADTVNVFSSYLGAVSSKLLLFQLVIFTSFPSNPPLHPDKEIGSESKHAARDLESLVFLIWEH